MNWVLFLHFYQPHNQKPHILKQIVNEAYLPLLRLFKANPRLKISLNINACLTEQLAESSRLSLKLFNELISKGQIEIVASAKHHAFLPLIPEEEVLRQVELDWHTNQKYLGAKLYHPQGFFPPELAYGPNVLSAIVKKNYNYMLIDEISVSNKLGLVDWSQKYALKDQQRSLSLVPVNRHWSNQLRTNHDINADEFFWYAKGQFANKETVLITANDAELFGHHYVDRLQLLESAAKDEQINFFTISDYLKLRTTRPIKKISPHKGTWETYERDLQTRKGKTKLPYPLWYDPDNQIQRLHWKLVRIAIANYTKILKPMNDSGLKWKSGREYLDLGLSSCFWWWASCKPWWDPDMICFGALQLIKSVRSSPVKAEEKMLAEKIYVGIITKVWEWHWSGKAQIKIDEFERKVGHGLYWVRTQPTYW